MYKVLCRRMFLFLREIFSFFKGDIFKAASIFLLGVNILVMQFEEKQCYSKNF